MANLPGNYLELKQPRRWLVFVLPLLAAGFFFFAHFQTVKADVDCPTNRIPCSFGQYCCEGTKNADGSLSFPDGYCGSYDITTCLDSNCLPGSTAVCNSRNGPSCNGFYCGDMGTCGCSQPPACPADAPCGTYPSCTALSCDGTCDGAVKDSCGNCNGVGTPSNLGSACGTTSNACGSCTQGTIVCSSACVGGSCPPVPGNLGSSCGPTSNACGSCTQGTIDCSSACVGASCPPVPGNLGQSCNACGGTWQCDGSCSPSCPPNPCTAPDSCGAPPNCFAPDACGTCGGSVSTVTCSVSCGGGTDSCGNTCNTQACPQCTATPGACNDNNACTTDSCVSGSCQNTNNPVNGTWSTSGWTDTSGCSVSCGGGTKTQSRTVTCSGASCGGSCDPATEPVSTQTVQCNTQACTTCTPNTTRPCGSGFCAGTETCDASGNWSSCSTDNSQCAAPTICTSGAVCSGGTCPAPTPVNNGGSCGFDPATCQNDLCQSGTCTAQADICGPGPCTYSISPPNASVSAASGSGSFTVTASSGSCAWTASITSGGSWLTITNGTNHTGSATVNYSYTANGSTARAGTILAGGQTYTLNQGGTGATNPVLNVHWAGGGNGNINSISPDTGIACNYPTFSSCSKSYTAGTAITLEAIPLSGNEFSGWSGGGCTGTNQTCTVTLNLTTDVYASFNPAPTAVVASNSTCGQINLSWGQFFAGATYNVYRATTNVMPASPLPGASNLSTLSYTDSGASVGQVYYYWVQGTLGASSETIDANSNYSGGIGPTACNGNLNASSDKDVASINGQAVSYTKCNGRTDALPSSTTLKLGDDLVFSLNICNTGSGQASSISLTDNMTNLSSLTGSITSATTDWNVYYDPGSGSLQRLGSGNNISLQASGSLPNATLKFNNIPNLAGGTVSNPTISRILIEAKLAIPSGFVGTLARFQNLFNLLYNSGSLNNGTPPLPFYVGGGGPTRTEVAPQ